MYDSHFIASNYSSFILSFWIWKVWKGRENITKIWISGEWKELFRWNKKHFMAFEGLSFGEKMTEVLKNGEIVDRSFKLLIKSKFLTKKMVDTNSGKNIIFSFWTQRNLEVKINTNSIKIMYSKNFYSFCHVSHFQILNLKIFFHFFLW